MTNVTVSHAGGIITTGTILDDILAHKRREVTERKQLRSLADIRALAATASPPRDFEGALRAPGIALIAEVKRASPSRGLLRAGLDPIQLARTYEAAGAAAISVLTDTRYFRGSLEDLALVHGAVQVPVLCKEFILDPYQICEARAAGADAVLLIVAALPTALLDDLLALVHELGMTALVEVHTGQELDRALGSDPAVIGINNRNLHTFEIDLATTLALRPDVPAGIAVVAESGIGNAADVARFASAGIDAVLVGTALVASGDPGATARELFLAGKPNAGSCP